jgi:type I site-specific restriction endonuclease
MFNFHENQARQEIDRLLETAGWIIQNHDTLALGAGRGADGDFIVRGCEPTARLIGRPEHNAGGVVQLMR